VAAILPAKVFGNATNWVASVGAEPNSPLLFRVD
jgi:hypothetical protein